MTRLRRHLTYSNVVSTLCLFVVLGAGAYAAGLGRDSVKSKQIKDEAVKTKDLKDAAVTAAKIAPGVIGAEEIANGSIAGRKLADGAVGGDKLADNAVNSAKVADDSLTGADISETGLSGVDAAKVGGQEIKKIDFRPPFNAPTAAILVYPGIFRIDAQCSTSGDIIDIAAFTGRDGSTISAVGIGTSTANDENGTQDLASALDGNFNTGDAIEVDQLVPRTLGVPLGQVTIHFQAPAGFVATTWLDIQLDGVNGCSVTGSSIGG